MAKNYVKGIFLTDSKKKKELTRDICSWIKHISMRLYLTKLHMVFYISFLTGF